MWLISPINQNDLRFALFNLLEPQPFLQSGTNDRDALSACLGGASATGEFLCLE